MTFVPHWAVKQLRKVGQLFISICGKLLTMNYCVALQCEASIGRLCEDSFTVWSESVSVLTVYHQTVEIKF